MHQTESAYWSNCIANKVNTNSQNWKTNDFRVQGFQVRTIQSFKIWWLYRHHSKLNIPSPPWKMSAILRIFYWFKSPRHKIAKVLFRANQINVIAHTSLLQLLTLLSDGRRYGKMTPPMSWLTPTWWPNHIPHPSDLPKNSTLTHLGIARLDESIQDQMRRHQLLGQTFPW